jgi:glucosamine--fructose-6-phosphate aminotransferase (isomerizing)
LKDSLEVQSELALDFIAHAWPEARDAANAVVAPITADVTEVVITGCGDSYHASAALEMAFSSWSGKRARGSPAMGAARYLTPRISASNAGVLFIGISVSGEVARTLEAMELARLQGAHTLALTGNVDSSLGQAALSCMSVGIPDVPAGPGLINFLGSLLMGFAVARALSGESERLQIDRCFDELPEALGGWLVDERQSGKEFAERIDGEYPMVFLGSGPGFGMAMFSAAKLIEAAGVPAWGQDVEEWAHVEYFTDPPNLPTWLLSSGGRSLSREDEVEHAAQVIERDWMLSRWQGHPRWKSTMREAISPLALWAGPSAFASRRAALLGETAFRGFGGGRSVEEGGGASRIRSSLRLRDPLDLQE